MPRKPKSPKAQTPAVKESLTTDVVSSVDAPDSPVVDEREAKRVEERLFAIRQEYGMAMEMRLRKNYKIWWSGKDLDEKKATITTRDIDELRRFNLLPTKSESESGDPTEKYPQEVSQREMGEIISKQFDTKVDHVALSRLLKSGAAWIKPCKGLNSRWKTELTLRLWAENMGDKKSYESDAELARENKRLANQRLRDDIAQFQKEHDLEWGKLSQMKAVLIGLAAILTGLWDRFCEDKDGVRRLVREAGLKVGIAEDLLLRLDAELAPALISANDGMKAQAGIEGERAQKRFEQQRKEELKEKL